jgi:anti-sigma-K factor RskA
VTGLPRGTADLADEYVLGLLDPAEAMEVEARLAGDPALAAAVAAARDRFVEIDLTAPDLGADPALWRRIEAGIAAAAGQGTGGEAARPAVTNVVPMRPAAERAPAPTAAAGRGWRMAAIASLAAALLLAVGLGWQVMRTRPPQMVAVILDDATGVPVLTVEAREGGLPRVTILSDVALPAGKTLQIWTVPEGATAPVSFGVMPGAVSGPVPADLESLPVRQQLFAVSIEDAGGSPTGKPTGRVLGHGRAEPPR